MCVATRDRTKRPVNGTDKDAPDAPGGQCMKTTSGRDEAVLGERGCERRVGAGDAWGGN
jgi:hypothetical protein